MSHVSSSTWCFSYASIAPVLNSTNSLETFYTDLVSEYDDILRVSLQICVRDSRKEQVSESRRLADNVMSKYLILKRHIEWKETVALHESDTDIFDINDNPIDHSKYNQ